MSSGCPKYWRPWQRRTSTCGVLWRPCFGTFSRGSREPSYIWARKLVRSMFWTACSDCSMKDKLESRDWRQRRSLGSRLWQESRGVVRKISQGSRRRQTWQTVERQNQQMAITPKTGLTGVSPGQRWGLKFMIEILSSTIVLDVYFRDMNGVAMFNFDPCLFPSREKKMCRSPNSQNPWMWLYWGIRFLQMCNQVTRRLLG